MEPKLFTIESINNPLWWGISLLMIGFTMQIMYTSDASSKGFGGEGNRIVPDITILGLAVVYGSILSQFIGLGSMIYYCETEKRKEALMNGRAADEAV
jgi:hypothetical protein